MGLHNKSIVLPSLSAAILLLIAIFPIKEYGFYVVLRWIVCFSAIFIGCFSFMSKRHNLVWLMGIIAILFNPIEPIHLSKGIWQVIDFCVAGIFVMAIFAFKLISGYPQVEITKNCVRFVVNPKRLFFA